MLLKEIVNDRENEDLNASYLINLSLLILLKSELINILKLFIMNEK